MISNLLVAFWYILLSYITDQFLELKEIFTSLFWPSIGVAYYFYLKEKKQVFPGIFIGSLTQGLFLDFNYFSDHYFLLYFHFLYALSLILIFHYMTKIILKEKAHFDIKEIYENFFSKVNFLLYPLICLLLSILASFLLMLFNVINSSEYGITFYKWFIGNYAGLVLLTPFCIYHKGALVSKKNRNIILCVVLAILFKLSGFYYITYSENKALDNQNKLRSLSIFESYQIKFTKLEAILESYNGYFSSSNFISSDEYLSFSRSVYNTHLDIKSIEWISIIKNQNQEELYNKEIEAFSKKIDNPLKGYPFYAYTYSYPLDANFHRIGKKLTHDKPTYELINKAYKVDYPVFGSINSIKDHDTYGYAVSVRKSDKIIGVLLLSFSFIENFNTKLHYGLDQRVFIDNKLIDHISSDLEDELVKKSFKFEFLHGDRMWRFEFLYPHSTYSKYRGKANVFTYTILFFFFSALLTLIFFMLGTKDRIEKEVDSKTRKLKEVNDELLSISDHKTKFLANMSHEIRTPLNGILATSQILRSELKDKSYDDKLEVIHSSAELLLMIVNDILDLTKIESNQIQLESRSFDLFKLVDDVITSLKSLSEKRGISFEVIKDPDMPRFFMGDVTRIMQILLNLVNNAVKFSHSEGVVAVNLAYLDGRVLINVEDNGIGIDPNKRDKIFMPFTQADLSTTRKYGGTGLGLNISKKLVELMGGTINFSSVLGKGTKFTIYLPLNIGQEQKDEENIESSLFPIDSLEILLVEDNPINQKVFEMIAEKLSFNFDYAQNGLEAVNMHRTKSYDVIFMDVQMPVMDGLSATEEIRKYDQNVHIIGLSANAFKEDIEVGRKAGMNQYISKPVTIEKIQKVFNDLV